MMLTIPHIQSRKVSETRLITGFKVISLLFTRKRYATPQYRTRYPRDQIVSWIGLLLQISGDFNDQARAWRSSNLKSLCQMVRTDAFC